MHSLEREDEEVINNMLRNYKENYKKCKVELVDELESGVQILFTDLEVYDQKKEIKDRYERAKKKEQDKKDIEKGYFKWEDERYDK